MWTGSVCTWEQYSPPARKLDLSHATLKQSTDGPKNTGLQSDNSLEGNAAGWTEWFLALPYKWMSHKSFCASICSQSGVILWQADNYNDAPRTEGYKKTRKRKRLALNEKIHLIVSANVWRDLWMNVVLLCCGGSTKTHSTVNCTSSASPFPLGALFKATLFRAGK